MFKPIILSEKTPKERFREFVKQEAIVNRETINNQWQLYRHLKKFIPTYNIDHEEAVKIITKELEI